MLDVADVYTYDTLADVIIGRHCRSKISKPAESRRFIWLLPIGSQWHPSKYRCGANNRYELAAIHSITSSARASSMGGTSRQSAFAVLRLITSSYCGSGAPFGKRNGNYRHGHFTAAAKEQRRRLKSLIRDARKMLRSLV
jgi:hypothetical protein